MLCDVVRHRRRAHAPVIHAANHFDHKKRIAWVPISMHTCGSFFYNYGAPLGGSSGRRSSAIKTTHFPIVIKREATQVSERTNDPVFEIQAVELEYSRIQADSTCI